MQVKLDTIVESSARRTIEGLEIERVAIVTGLEGSKTGKLIKAMTAPGMPQYGALHPDDPTASLQEIIAEPIREDPTVRVRLIYKPQPVNDTVQDEISRREDTELITSIRITSFTQTDSTIRDINGDLMIVNYAGVPDLTSQLAGQIVIGYDIVEAEFDTPRLQVAIDVNLADLDKNVITEYIGGINNATWSGFPARTWLLSDISANKDGGLWRVGYTFQYRPETWDLEYAIEIRGGIPQDARIGNGLERFQLYRPVNFNRLAVSW